MADMATGIIIGGTFRTIVKSLAGNVIMTLIGLLPGGVDFSNLTRKPISRGPKYTCSIPLKPLHHSLRRI